MSNNNSEIDKILAREGGFVDDPLDKGGTTKFGITKATLEWFRKGPVSKEDVRNMSIEEAKAIYFERFIKIPGFDKLPEGMLKSNLIDFGVLSGPNLAIMNLQDALGVESDGVLGPTTLTALLNSDQSKLNVAIAKKRLLMCGRIVAKTPNQSKFLVGWMNRILSFL